MTNTEQKIGDVFKLGYADRMQEYDIYESCMKNGPIRDGEALIRVADIYHALHNSDRYPVSYPAFTSMDKKGHTLSGELCLEMFKAVIETIDDVPRYKVHKSQNGYEVHKEQMPSAQPEIIHCKECKFYTEMRQDLDTGICRLACRHLGGDGFCSEAELKSCKV